MGLDLDIGRIEEQVVEQAVDRVVQEAIGRGDLHSRIKSLLEERHNRPPEDTTMSTRNGRYGNEQEWRRLASTYADARIAKLETLAVENGWPAPSIFAWGNCYRWLIAKNTTLENLSRIVEAEVWR